MRRPDLVPVSDVHPLHRPTRRPAAPTVVRGPRPRRRADVARQRRSLDFERRAHARQPELAGRRVVGGGHAAPPHHHRRRGRRRHRRRRRQLRDGPVRRPRHRRRVAAGAVSPRRLHLPAAAAAAARRTAVAAGRCGFAAAGAGGAGDERIVLCHVPSAAAGLPHLGPGRVADTRRHRRGQPARRRRLQRCRRSVVRRRQHGWPRLDGGMPHVRKPHAAPRQRRRRRVRGDDRPSKDGGEGVERQGVHDAVAGGDTTVGAAGAVERGLQRPRRRAARLVVHAQLGRLVPRRPHPGSRQVLESVCARR